VLPLSPSHGHARSGGARVDGPRGDALCREIENIGDSVKQTVAELQLGTRPCISVKVFNLRTSAHVLKLARSSGQPVRAVKVRCHAQSRTRP
jgi:hypothetical protein